MDSVNNTAGRRIRVYFLGSGGIGLPAFDSLTDAPDIDVVGVGTRPDRPAGRRRIAHSTPVAKAAARRGISPDKPSSVNAANFLSHLQNLALDIIVLMAFGQILKPEILSLPPYGCLNIHASLLPRHRGASPIQAAIVAGDTESGISFMNMNKGLDTGPVYEEHPVSLAPDETASSLEIKLAEIAAENVCNVVRSVVCDGVQPRPQDHRRATLAPKLKKSDGQINWREPADLIERKIRAFTPWPRAYFFIKTGRKERRIQVVKAIADAQKPVASKPGQILQADKHDWVIACGAGCLHLQRIIPSGKKEMTASEFLRGTQLQVGNVVKGAPKGEGPTYEATFD